MAIILNVESYCQDCPDFDPKKEVIEFEAGTYEPLTQDNMKSDTIVTCSFKERCNCMYINMERRMKR